MGASGFIPKTSAPEVTISAIQLVLSGGVYIPPHVLKPQTKPIPNNQQPNNTDTFNTLSFEDGSNAWISFYSYKPNFASSLKNHYYTFKDGAIWKQYDDNTTSSRANFYGVQYRSKER